jgi:hypothetical protein
VIDYMCRGRPAYHRRSSSISPSFELQKDTGRIPK